MPSSISLFALNRLLQFITVSVLRLRQPQRRQRQLRRRRHRLTRCPGGGGPRAKKQLGGASLCTGNKQPSWSPYHAVTL